MSEPPTSIDGQSEFEDDDYPEEIDFRSQELTNLYETQRNKAFTRAIPAVVGTFYTPNVIADISAETLLSKLGGIIGSIDGTFLAIKSRLTENKKVVIKPTQSALGNGVIIIEPVMEDKDLVEVAVLSYSNDRTGRPFITHGIVYWRVLN